MGENARAEWRTGWPLVLSGAVGLGMYAMHVYGLGAFVQPLEHEFGWSRSQVTSGPAIVSAVSLIGLPSVGILLDRYSRRAVAICCS
jgi:NO-binding membrane sensor protein with MHYT domain